MQTFWWKVQNNSQTSATPKTKVIKFGDGYEQRTQNGINNNLKNYSVTLVGIREDLIWALKFLEDHGAIKAFLWKEPSTYKNIKVVCRSWTSTPNGNAMTITATFEEVVA